MSYIIAREDGGGGEGEGGLGMSYLSWVVGSALLVVASRLSVLPMLAVLSRPFQKVPAVLSNPRSTAGHPFQSSATANVFGQRFQNMMVEHLR